MKQRRYRITPLRDRDDPEWMDLGRRAAADHCPSPSEKTRGYPQLYIVEDGMSRCLHFGPDYVQSRMNVDEPYALPLAYTRQMMAFLLFCPVPRDVVIVGLGGGSLTKFCYRHLPRTRITTVEISAQVIGLAPTFDVPPPDERMRIVHADAVDYFATTADRADVILLDGCDESGIDPAFCNERFYQNVRARLRYRGLLVANLVGSTEVKKKHADLIANSFDHRSIVQSFTTEANKVAFAFSDPRSISDWAAISSRARKLERKYGLDFPAFARNLQRRHERQEQPSTSP